ncbi:filamentous hemagglutinin N-terminal domain-containing protein [Enterobacter cancerogenus]|uniref:two-partner secretion domain-containing protein n=1 Tax=Enterobacter cancerogenus TaxID=69218 RepID=UPI000734AF3B|nr:filamentous hemagglutinin N-terminal domain-containing protein [Enterobacter cancerogenus]
MFTLKKNVILSTTIMAVLSGSAFAAPQVINIDRPNSSGISVNDSKSFNVGPNGMILNNSATAAKTQLGGQIQGNKNLVNGKMANVIVNEVLGSQVSKLNGIIEVAGQKADVIIANPNGINCSGCGFINANRAVLSAGYYMNGKTLISPSSNKSIITFTGKGLVNPDLADLELNAKKISINAPVKVNNVHMNASWAAPTTVAIDVGSLGKIEADSIYMVAQKGSSAFAVNNNGLLQANKINIDTAGNIVYGPNEGSITNTGLIHGSDVSVKTGSLANSLNGYIASTKSLNISSMAFNNNGNVHSDKDINLKVNDIVNSGLVSSANNTNLSNIVSFKNTYGTIAAKKINIDDDFFVKVKDINGDVVYR